MPVTGFCLASLLWLTVLASACSAASGAAISHQQPIAPYQDNTDARGWRAVLANSFWVDCLSALASAPRADAASFGRGPDRAREHLRRLLGAIQNGDLEVQEFEEAVPQLMVPPGQLERIASAAGLAVAPLQNKVQARSCQRLSLLVPVLACRASDRKSVV